MSPLSPALGAPPPEALVPHLPRAVAAARRLLGCDHLAADAVQEALVAYCGLAAPPPDPVGWLLVAVRHRARHLRRTLRRRSRHEQHAAATRCQFHPDCDNPLHHAHAHELGERVTAAIAALPGEQRVAFERFEHDGHDYAAIARELALPIGTVRSRLHRARRALQRIVEPSLPDAHDRD
ncbi:MAG: sigma-70 family RNA polymerase sigma factor [Planctomycetes bacterium]|nr:sigma-70 family RNA polymerase sigma factor [Planctomycetota bacterium]